MFILRKQSKSSFETFNFIIGDSYSTVDKESHPDNFKLLIGKENYAVKSEIYAFLSYRNGTRILPLYRGTRYIMMTSTGCEFEDISSR